MFQSWLLIIFSIKKHNGIRRGFIKNPGKKMPGFFYIISRAIKIAVISS